jgi:catechol 2,3-dioxygenase-like lactoylglutathione lyase family enzyme
LLFLSVAGLIDMSMYSHVMLGANDIAVSTAFYNATLGALGYPAGFQDPKGRVFWMAKAGIFSISLPIDGNEATCANGGTIGFSAQSPEEADAWHAAGLANGGTAIEDPPGWREGNGMKFYLAYLRDPAGNKICAMHSGT